MNGADGPFHVSTKYTNNASVSKCPDEENEVTPCPNNFHVTHSPTEINGANLRRDVFHREPNDNDIALFIEDQQFLKIMEEGIKKNEHGNWEMPLPFRQQVSMPNNRAQALRCLRSLLKPLERKPQMKHDYLEFMAKIIGKCHASVIPPDQIETHEGQAWYLPHFGVYHPKKPTQIRVVFDSSSEYGNTSLNKELLSGPELGNSLVGVLIRFRREKVAVMCDIEQMFHSFHVRPDHRNFLRFLWFENNDPQKSIVEYRMNDHLFGNGPSPVVATFGLRRTVNNGEEVDDDFKNFVNRDFYVDDGLTSAPTANQAIQLVSEAQSILASANLRLHKVVSNSLDVMPVFSSVDRAEDLRDLDLNEGSLPTQRSLGVYWDIENDAFTFRVQPPNKPFTRRGVLAVVNSVYDPLGLAAPVVLDGKKLLQRLVEMGKTSKGQSSLGWDDPLPEELLNK